MIMKKIVLSLVLLLAVCASPVFAAEPVYVVDMQRVISESIIGKAAKADMEAELKKREGSLTKTQNDLKAMKADIDKQASVLSKDAMKAKQEALMAKDREFQRSFQENREALGKKNNEAIGAIIKDIDAIIKDLSKENSYKIVLEKDQRFVLYIDDSYDLTDKVIKALNDKKLN
jgi:outer membrane protein